MLQCLFDTLMAPVCSGHNGPRETEKARGEARCDATVPVVLGEPASVMVWGFNIRSICVSGGCK